MAIGKKTGGRQKGTPNRMTFEARQMLTNVLAEEFVKLPELLAKLEPEQRIDLTLKLAKYVLPTIQPIDIASAERESLKDPVAALKAIQSSNKLEEILALRT